MATAKVSAQPPSVVGRASYNQLATHVLAAGLEALEMLNIGVTVTNRARRVLFANKTAEEILLSRDGLEVTPQGVLQPVGKWSNPTLARVIQRAAQRTEPDNQQDKDVILAMRRPSGKRSFTLLVRSLTGRTSPVDLAAPSVLVFMWDPELPEHDTEAGLRELFGFTSCEARLANLLMKGRSVDECCSDLAIRPSTVRMHLANLFAKTGVQRQGQLVSLLWKSVGMVRPKYGPATPQERSAQKDVATPSQAMCDSEARRAAAARILTRQFGL